MCVIYIYIGKKTSQHSTDGFIDMRKAFFIHVQKEKRTYHMHNCQRQLWRPTGKELSLIESLCYIWYNYNSSIVRFLLKLGWLFDILRGWGKIFDFLPHKETATRCCKYMSGRMAKSPDTFLSAVYVLDFSWSIFCLQF